jgi:hypothetical protein
MRNYFMAVDNVFKILASNCWNSFLPPWYSRYPIDLIL